MNAFPQHPPARNGSGSTLRMVAAILVALAALCEVVSLFVTNGGASEGARWWGDINPSAWPKVALAMALLFIAAAVVAVVTSRGGSANPGVATVFSTLAVIGAGWYLRNLEVAFEWNLWYSEWASRWAAWEVASGVIALAAVILVGIAALKDATPAPTYAAPFAAAPAAGGPVYRAPSAAPPPPVPQPPAPQPPAPQSPPKASVEDRLAEVERLLAAGLLDAESAAHARTRILQDL